jgi:hypothetical protein
VEQVWRIRDPHVAADVAFAGERRGAVEARVTPADLLREEYHVLVGRQRDDPHSLEGAKVPGSGQPDAGGVPRIAGVGDVVGVGDSGDARVFDAILFVGGIVPFGGAHHGRLRVGREVKPILAAGHPQARDPFEIFDTVQQDVLIAMLGRSSIEDGVDRAGEILYREDGISLITLHFHCHLPPQCFYSLNVAK